MATTPTARVMEAVRFPPTSEAVPAALPRASRAGGAFVGFLARGVQGLTWQRVGAVLLFCALYGGVLSLDPATGGAPRSMAAYLAGVAIALTTFLPVLVVATLAANRAPRRLPWRALVVGAAVVPGIAIAHYLTMATQELVAGLTISPPQHAFSPLPLLMMCWLGVAAMLLLERERDAAQAMHEAEERQLEVTRLMAEARLQALHAQIEPHFLFNTLAHVRRLYKLDPESGRATMHHLTRYVDIAMRSLRDPSIGLDEDVELAVAYLNVQKIRLGARLTFDVDIAPDAAGTRVPPLAIVTLVENAVKHGIAPLTEGGAVRIVARREGPMVRVEVSDTGQGFQASLGAGVGLANLRARLSTLYGADATLALHQGSPRGVVATVVVPGRAFAVGAMNARRFVPPPSGRAPVARIASIAAAVWRAVTWKHVVGTFLLCAAWSALEVASATANFSRHPSWDRVLNNFLSMQLSGFAVMAALLIVDAASFSRRHPWWAYLVAVVAAVASATIVFWFVSQEVFAISTGYHPSGLPEGFATIAFRHGTSRLAICGLAAYVYVCWRFAQDRLAALRAVQLARAAAEKRALETRLALVQGHVEPQMLTTALANIERLYDIDAPAADGVLKELTAYLRAAIPRSENRVTTVADEVRLANAYLNVVSLRSRNCLVVEEDAVHALAGAHIPPTVLLPLIKRALARRTERAAGDARFRIHVSVADRNLVLTIRDDGDGFAAREPGDAEIEQIRSRLLALCGETATLTLMKPGSGTAAVISIPHVTVASARIA